MVNIGKVTINDKLLLNWLQFPFGKIVNIKHSEDGFDLTEITIEDDEMPRVDEGGIASNVMLSFSQYQDYSGHKVAVREPLNKESYGD